jgi:hypothetical protein
MNVESGTQVVQFPEKEYINGIFVAVYIRNANILKPGFLWIINIYKTTSL